MSNHSNLESENGRSVKKQDSENTNNKKTGRTTLKSDKVDFKIRYIAKNKENFIMTKGIINQ